ncbi:MAG: DsbA family protein [Actinomycetota bacterium]|nr:DsbA family protein [Actinomycetota bacterium]
MASRSSKKEAARAQRLAEEQAKAERERRQRRMQMLAGVVVAAVAVVVVAIVLSTGGGSAKALKHGTQASQTTTAVEQLLSGIPQSGARLGNPKAPVTITYFGDLECPACAQFTLAGGFAQLVANDVRRGKVQVLYHSLETATTDPATFQTQQTAALAAGQQRRFWDYAELFYHEQGTESSGYVNESYLDGLAGQIPGLNLNRWSSARKDPALSSQLQVDMQAALGAGAHGTPTLIAQGPKGKSQVPGGIPSYSQLELAIKSVA